jgi:hypothetical protein
MVQDVQGEAVAQEIQGPVLFFFFSRYPSNLRGRKRPSHVRVVRTGRRFTLRTLAHSRTDLLGVPSIRPAEGKWSDEKVGERGMGRNRRKSGKCQIIFEGGRSWALLIVPDGSFTLRR